jgi:hypothetical protein
MVDWMVDKKDEKKVEMWAVPMVERMVDRMGD